MEVGTRVRVKHLPEDTWPATATHAMVGVEGVVEHVFVALRDEAEVTFLGVRLARMGKPLGPDSRAEKDAFDFLADELEFVAAPAPDYVAPAMDDCDDDFEAGDEG